MKFILIFASVLSLTLTASAQLEYRQTTFTPTLPSGSTNAFVVDTRNTSGLALQVALTGSGANTTTALIGVTNAANAAFPQTIAVTVGAVTSTYQWTNNVTALVTNLSALATNLVIGVTNFSNATNGQTFNIVLNNRTNTFTFATPATLLKDVATNGVIEGLATNIANSLTRTFKPRVVTVAGAIVTLTSLASDYQISESDAGGFITNNSVGFYTITNIVATNSLQLLTTSTPTLAAVNLFNQLSNDFSGSCVVSQPSATVVSLVTIGNPGLTVTETGAWATNAITTNAITGFVYFNGSNSLDKVTWFRATTRDFVLPLNGTSRVSIYTNFTDIFAAGWWSWSVENAATNYANAIGIQILAAVKQGL